MHALCSAVAPVVQGTVRDRALAGPGVTGAHLGRAVHFSIGVSAGFESNDSTPGSLEWVQSMHACFAGGFMEAHREQAQKRQGREAGRVDDSPWDVATFGRASRVEGASSSLP